MKVTQLTEQRYTKERLKTTLNIVEIHMSQECAPHMTRYAQNMERQTTLKWVQKPSMQTPRDDKRRAIHHTYQDNVVVGVTASNLMWWEQILNFIS